VPDPRVKQFIDWFVTAYESELGRKYIVAGGKDGKLVKTLLGKVSIDELKRAGQPIRPTGRQAANCTARGGQ